MEHSVFLGKTDFHTTSLLPNDIAYMCENSACPHGENENDDSSTHSSNCVV